ncbi:MAG: hypothetical protein O3A00_06080 [Planctomycetota bacterium]|nr:hypothetical protein [Planctomycetota bacterium]
MATYYDYVLAVWLRLEMEGDVSGLADELQEYLFEIGGYQVLKLEVMEASEDETEGEVEISLQIQFTFTESEMEEGEEPTEDAIATVDTELRRHLEAKCEVAYLELMDDAGTSYLLGEHEDDEISATDEPQDDERIDF